MSRFSRKREGEKYVPKTRRLTLHRKQRRERQSQRLYVKKEKLEKREEGRKATDRPEGGYKKEVRGQGST